MNSCQSPLHAWYLKYDYFTISESCFLSCIEEIIKGLSTTVFYTQSEFICSCARIHTSWISSIQFSTNNFDKRIQEFVVGALTYTLDFFRNELMVCDSELQGILERCYNFATLEVHYCQTFWKAAVNKPIPEFLRDRLICSLYRIEAVILDLNQYKSMRENDVFKGVLKLLSEILKSLMLEIQYLQDSYPEYFRYLLRIFNLLKIFPLIEDRDQLEGTLSSVLPLSNVKSMMNFLLEKARNKNSFKAVSNSYRLLVEESLLELRSTKKSESSEINDPELDILGKRLSSKTHSNSVSRKSQADEDFETLENLQKRTSKSIGSNIFKVEKSQITSEIPRGETPKLQKTLTFKSEQDESESIPFLDKLTNSYLTTQIMNAESFITSSTYKQTEILPTDPQPDLSIIKSKLLMRSPNLPFNSLRGMLLTETAIDDSLGAKMVAGLKNGSKNTDLQETQCRIPNRSLLSLIPSRHNITFMKKKSEIGDKLNQNLYTVLISRDANQIRDNILIAKNKKSAGKQTSKLESGDIEDFFEKRRKDRIIHSNRESCIKDPEELMTKSGRKFEELVQSKLQEKTSLQSNDERKPPKEVKEVKDPKQGKTIDVVIVKEKDLIKINKTTEITEKMKATLFTEMASNDICDEELIELSESTLPDEGNPFKEENLLDYIGTFYGRLEETNEEFWYIPGLRVKLESKRKNIMEFFAPINYFSARRKGMYESICQGLIENKDELVGESGERKLLYCKREGNRRWREQSGEKI